MRHSRAGRQKKGASSTKTSDAEASVALSIECADEATAKSLNEALMPDNRYFPKDQRFEASMTGSTLQFTVSSPRARPVISTVTSIISDARLFRDVWIEARTRGLGKAPQ